ncbi:noroxomaritidine synthase [Brachypodium distachyon]|uniref:Cytochrome P450 n=1 Tax=Brachypodium distachyon TaxID=15368 RepID=A0A0Q3G762_BRADI|nr:noroxomaritidine synthase [Brachypodium distachyon]KQK07191.1 hypothetical protein BRADI_2g33670v3 [Brachypodium distachyon]PNT71687.1 hypothetical protein BRADI_2g33670v3 [Brachypodium distachyon]|eukprot:XP_003568803.2 noroxomaritidine synthase [Brachypodium distachyon]
MGITMTMGAFRTFFLSYPEFLLAALCFVSLSALRLALRWWQRRGGSSSLPVRWPVVGMLPFVLRNRGRLLDAATAVLRDSGFTFMFGGPWLARADFLVTCDPAAVRHCLAANFSRYDKGRDFAEMFDIIGDGLLVSEAASWVGKRHIAVSVFAAPAFRSFVISTVFRQTRRLLVPFLDHHAATGISSNAIELEEVFMRFALDVTYASVFAADIDSLSIEAAGAPFPPFGEATRITGEAVMFRHVVPARWWKLLRWLNLGMERRLAEARKVLDEFVYLEIAKRKADPLLQGEGGGDLLSMYMGWAAKADPAMTGPQRDAFLRDAAVGYMFAAKDLIAAALTWLFYMLCTHPRVEEKILHELTSLRRPTPTDSPFTVFDGEALRSASYLHAAVLETLRLHPPAPFEEKEARGDDVLPDGTRVSEGTRVVFCIYAMGRMEGIWGEDCMEYKPERWLSGGGQVRHEPSYKFAAFNSGPRSCLGKDLGLTNLKIAAAAIVYNFRVELVEGHAVEPKDSVVLHAKNGLMVRVKRRVHE